MEQGYLSIYITWSWDQARKGYPRLLSFGVSTMFDLTICLIDPNQC